MSKEILKEFVKELSQKIRHFSCGQYEEHSVEMIAFQDGVSTAIGMMSIDLLGGVKNKGMLENLLINHTAELKKELILLFSGLKYPFDSEYNKAKADIIKLLKHYN